MNTITKKILNTSTLSKIRKANKDKIIVFCSGCYDILQSGHAVFFQQCKQYGDILVVGVGRDSTIKKLKGPGRPVNNQNNRLYLVAAMQDVDYAILNDEKIKKDKIDFENIVKILQPDIFVLNNDDSGIESKKQLCKTMGIKLVLVPRTVPKMLEATSTTKIIEKINFAYKAPLRIDFAGGWTDIPFLMKNNKGYVTNAAITPHLEFRNGIINYSGYPRGSGISTSTAVKLLKLMSAKNYNIENKSLSHISEDLFNLENKELHWAIGRQDQYAIVYGGCHCFEFSKDKAVVVGRITTETLELFKKGLLLLHTGISRNAQSVVEEVYKNYHIPKGKDALKKLATYGKEFFTALKKRNFIACAQIMEKNFEAQKQLARSSSNENIDAIYDFAKKHGAYGGKVCGAGGGGALILYCQSPAALIKKIKKQFNDCFEISFSFEYNDIRTLNKL